ncbi:hypothetical protein Cpir12675_000634 [Ceratocystis pirilliformis]|uniref:Uncharacterized protein n=1 Tax=Ceratocystis pirilliformis TaxID=259994 RepID=A0ABR3ZL25_9PEZI
MTPFTPIQKLSKWAYIQQWVNDGKTPNGQSPTATTNDKDIGEATVNILATAAPPPSLSRPYSRSSASFSSSNGLALPFEHSPIARVSKEEGGILSTLSLSQYDAERYIEDHFAGVTFSPRPQKAVWDAYPTSFTPTAHEKHLSSQIETDIIISRVDMQCVVPKVVSKHQYALQLAFKVTSPQALKLLRINDIVYMRLLDNSNKALLKPRTTESGTRNYSKKVQHSVPKPSTYDKILSSSPSSSCLVSDSQPAQHSATSGTASPVFSENSPSISKPGDRNASDLVSSSGSHSALSQHMASETFCQFREREFNARVKLIDHETGIITVEVSGISFLDPRGAFKVTVLPGSERFADCRLSLALCQQAMKQELDIEALQRNVITQIRNSWMHNMLYPTTEYGVSFRNTELITNYISRGLLPEQKYAVSRAVANNYGTIPFIIKGFPGVPYTPALVECALQILQKRDHRHSVLICTKDHESADAIVAQMAPFLGPGQMLRLMPSDILASSKSPISTYYHIKDNRFALPPPGIMMQYQVVVARCLDAITLTNHRLTNADLFVSAVSGARNLKGGITRVSDPFSIGGRPDYSLHWDALIIDSACQIPEHETAIPLAIMAPPTQEMVLVCNVNIKSQPQVILGGEDSSKPIKCSPVAGSALNESWFKRLWRRPVYSMNDYALGMSLEKAFHGDSIEDSSQPAFFEMKSLHAPQDQDTWSKSGAGNHRLDVRKALSEFHAQIPRIPGTGED